jgi:hypothetical protein
MGRGDAGKMLERCPSFISAAFFRRQCKRRRALVEDATPLASSPTVLSLPILPPLLTVNGYGICKFAFIIERQQSWRLSKF